jgi:hypothetical protein
VSRTVRFITLLLLAAVLAGCTSAAGGSPAATNPPAATDAPKPTDPPTFEGGTGIISFGASYNTNTLKIIKPATSFKTSSKLIAWSADFSENAGDTAIKLILASRSSGGGETVIYRVDAEVADPSFNLVANKTDLASLLDRKPGTYVMRYLRGGTTLAEGTFRLVK